MLVSGTFPAPLIAFVQNCWTHINRLLGLSCLDQVLVGLHTLLVSLSAWNLVLLLSICKGELFLPPCSNSVSIGESSLRGSMDTVSKKSVCSKTGFCHNAEGLLRQDCSFDFL